MLDQNELKNKFENVKGRAKNLWSRVKTKMNRNSEDNQEDETDYSSRLDIHEYGPDDHVATAPRTKRPLSSNGPSTSKAQNLVWDNEDASMQDKSYSFDEVTTDKDYDLDESEFEDDFQSGQERRYS